MFNSIVCYRRVIEGFNRYHDPSCFYRLGSIQLAVELSIKAKEILKLYPINDISSYSATWVRIPKKYSKTVLSDDVIIDAINALNNDKYLRTFGRYDYRLGAHLDGIYGFTLDSFVDKGGTVTNDFSEELMGTNNIYLGSIAGGLTMYNVDLKKIEPNLTSKGKLFLLMYIGYLRQWNGRDEKFKILQYSIEQRIKEKERVINLQQAQLDLLSKELDVSSDSRVYKEISDMILREREIGEEKTKEINP